MTYLVFYVTRDTFDGYRRKRFVKRITSKAEAKREVKRLRATPWVSDVSMTMATGAWA